MRVAWRKLDHRRSPAWPATGPVSARLRRARRSQFSRTWTGPPPSRPWAAPLARPSASRSRARHSMVATVPPRSSVAVEMERQMNACPCVSGCSATRQPIAGEGVVRQRPRVVLWRTVHSRRDPCDFFCCEKLELPAPFYIEYAPTRIAPLCESVLRGGFDILSSRRRHSTTAIAVGMMMMPSSGLRAGASVSVADGQT